MSLPGPSYYRAFASAARNGWADPKFFPIGTWFSAIENVSQLSHDAGMGLNSYFHLTTNSDLGLLDHSNFSTLLAAPFTRKPSKLVGDLLGDEVDMRAGPGYAPIKTSYQTEVSPCSDVKQQCGYSVMSSAKSDALSTGKSLTWANYGKGVAFWETNQQASKFVNDFTDVISVDIYFYTDPNVCQEAFKSELRINLQDCRRAGNYGKLIDRVRQLDAEDGRLQPVFAFVETGTPGEGWRTITPSQMSGAVMSSVIHGARGVIFFDHNFGGPCRSNNGLRDCDLPMQEAVRTVSAQLRDLAPALNSPARTVYLGPGTDSSLYADGESIYIIAMADASTPPGWRNMVLPESLRSWQVSAPYENRLVTRTGKDSFTDNFAEESSYHIYKLTP